jgi:hypothetical protein
VNADDITGLKFNDFDKDGNLDFLVVNHGFSIEDEQKLAIKSNDYKKLTCENSQCYKITVITLVNGEWRPLRNSQGDVFYFLIRLDEPLNPDSGFEVLDANWLE